MVDFEEYRAKQYHLGLGCESMAKTTLTTANQNSCYRIFEDFVFYLMKEACENRTTSILDIYGKKYTFDSTMIPLCFATFLWAKFRSKRGGVKVYALYDIKAQTSVFYIVIIISWQCLQFIMDQKFIIYLTGLMTLLKNSIGYIL